MTSDDQITELPDSVFEHILSFLPTKQAIATCLLSKGWRHLRLTLPNIDFDEANFHSIDSFLQYLVTVMSMRDDSETLKKFNLVLRSTACGRARRVKIINTWINTAVHPKVEHVEVHDKTGDNLRIKIPSSIFECNTITILKLTCVKVTTFSSFDLPSLQVLHLIFVIFLSNIRCAYNLVYGCPSLQDLSLKHCYMTCDHGHSIVPLDRGNLQVHVPPDYYASHYPSTLEDRLKNLVSANVYSYPFTLGSLSNVTTLRIDNIGYINETFYNLIHLEIRWFTENPDGRSLLECLRNYPKLETLIVHEFDWQPRRNQLWRNENAPQCVSSHLKEFHLGSFKGLSSEFRLARYIMEKARFLDIISIRRDIKRPNSEQEIKLRELSSCPRSSVNCRLLIE